MSGAQVHDKLVAFDVDEGAKGRGGMAAKVQAAWMAAEKGCTTVILNGKQPDCILQVRTSVPCIQHTYSSFLKIY